MADVLTRKALIERLKIVPDDASIYWYTEREKVVVRAEWTDSQGVGDFHHVNIMSYYAIQTGGPVL